MLQLVYEEQDGRVEDLPLGAPRQCINSVYSTMMNSLCRRNKCLMCSVQNVECAWGGQKSGSNIEAGVSVRHSSVTQDTTADRKMLAAFFLSQEQAGVLN